MTSRASLLPQLYRTIEETGDITFVVGSNSKEFKAHQFIIANLAKPLYDIAMIETETVDNKDTNNNDKGDESDDECNVVLEDIDESTFSAILESLYIRKMPNKLESVKEGKRIIVACEKFGCYDLKLKVESLLGNNLMSCKNAMDLLLFAESYTCPILKSYAMKMYRENPEQIMEENMDDWSSIEQHPKLICCGIKTLIFLIELSTVLLVIISKTITSVIMYSISSKYFGIGILILMVVARFYLNALLRICQLRKR